ncbi:phage tail tip lysozyme [Paraburkholderia mimosarum]|uniref:phage tail tip lysozyme n=1 Tax=Paraburkholderia mimosarum TaxID=312026 RepID=UPI00041E352E|nr:phage tail tip lysozyme [Paraburkholderia mimosarum]
MSNNGTAAIIDELFVSLGLDTTEYKKSDKTINVMIVNTEKKFEESDRKDKRRAEQRDKRLQSSTKQVKQFGEGLTKLATIAGAVLGVGGGAAGFIGMLAALTSTESAMRRATTATGMSVRQLNAWRGTMQAVTGDAEGGANAVTNLAREFTTGRLTGNMPTLQAFASVGVNARQGESIDAFLNRAQQSYRAASPGQQQNIENVLAARGVDANLIQLLKSKQNLGDVYGQKFAGSAEMNEGGVDAFNSALADFKNQMRNTATVIMTTVTPAIQAFGEWLTQANVGVSQFADDVKAAGGGLDGFMKTVDQRTPELGQALHGLADGLNVLGQVVDVAAFGLEMLAKAFGAAYDWLNDKLGSLLGMTDSKGGGNALDRIGALLKDVWARTVQVSRTYGPAPVSQVTGAAINPYGAAPIPVAGQQRMAALGWTARGAGGAVGAVSAVGAGRTNDTPMQWMNQAIASGFTPAEAAAFVANAQRESSLGANMGNSNHRGLLQWDPQRTAAFRKATGVDPNDATPAQAIQFVLNDPYERRLLRKSFANSGSAAALGESFSRVYEAHGNRAEDAARGRLAQRYYDAYQQQQTGQAAQTQTPVQPISINGPVTVVANEPSKLVSGIQRAVAPFSSGVR